MTDDSKRRPIKAIILSAGQGKRLLPLTQECPKSLLAVAGKTILEWQIDYLLAAGIEQICVVTGFGSKQVEAMLQDKYPQRPDIRVLFNPFYNLSDNLASCWIAAAEMDTDFLLLNGDTLFERALLDRVLASPSAPVTLTIDLKDSYDDDDMKVEFKGSRVSHVSKALPADRIDAESIGLLYFREDGPETFRATVADYMRDPSGLKLWYLAVVDALAGQDMVEPCSINGHRWAEIDNKKDLEHADRLFSALSRTGEGITGETGHLRRSSA